MNEVITQCSVVRWEDVVLEPDRLVLTGGVDAAGIVRPVQVDAEGRVVWAPEVDRLRRDLAEAREGWREAAQWLRRLVGIEAMPHWAQAQPWLFEEDES